MRGWRKGTRAIRIRTANRSGLVPGQPYAPVTDPLRIPHAQPEHHHCGECFGMRNASNPRLFCGPCLGRLFGGRWFYDSFLRSERARTRERERRLRARGMIT